MPLAAAERGARPSTNKQPKKPRAIVVQCVDENGAPAPCNDDGGGGGGTVGKCKACLLSAETGALYCDDSEKRWNPCKAQWLCYTMPGGGTHCDADCGTRCYSI